MRMLPKSIRADRSATPGKWRWDGDVMVVHPADEIEAAYCLERAIMMEQDRKSDPGFCPDTIRLLREFASVITEEAAPQMSLP
jgi:hypothetical protein